MSRVTGVGRLGISSSTPRAMINGITMSQSQSPASTCARASRSVQPQGVLQDRPAQRPLLAIDQ